MRIGIFGGTFDPVHSGHLVVAAAAAEALALDQIRLVPTALQPFKLETPVAHASHRLAMLSGATAGSDLLVVDDREIRRGGISYTIDSLISLHADFPGDELFLLVGADACQSLPAWRDAARFGEFCTVAELTRPGTGSSPQVEVRVEVPAVDVSSTRVRELVRAGKSIAGCVPGPVADYIAEHGLYR